MSEQKNTKKTFRQKIIQGLYIDGTAAFIFFLMTIWFEEFIPVAIIFKVFATFGAIGAFLAFLCVLSTSQEEDQMKKDKFTN